MQVPIIENVLKLNDAVAAINRRLLREAGVFTIDLIGGPGCGKTSLLEATLRRLKGEMQIGVLVGDLATARDGERLARWSDQIVQINTGKACHLDANQVRQAMNRVDLDRLDVLVIENVGNLICPVGFDLGQDVKVGMFSIAEGDDKAAKHPTLVQAADLLLINKMDLLQHQTFDMKSFLDDIHRLNSDAPVICLSAGKDQIGEWIDWVRQRFCGERRNACDDVFVKQ